MREGNRIIPKKHSWKGLENRFVRITEGEECIDLSEDASVKTSALIITRSLAFESSFSIEAILLIFSFFTGFAVAAFGSLLILAMNLGNLHLHFSSI